MNALRTFAHRHPLLAYGVLAFALSWSDWLALLAAGQRVGPGSTATHLPGLCGPFVAALIVTVLADGTQALRRFVRSCLTLPKPRLRWALLALSPLLLGALVFAALAASGQRLPPVQDFDSYPGTPPHWPLAASVLVVLLSNGLGEEGGWRGFLLPRLAQRCSRLRAALLTAAIWLLWHAPLFAVHAGMSTLIGPALVGWALGLVAGSIVLAWLYFASGSVLVVALWHTSFNVVVATAPGHGTVAAVCSTVVMVLGIVIGIAWWRRPSAAAAHAARGAE